MNKPTRRPAPPAARPHAAQTSLAGRIILAGAALVLLLSMAMEGPPRPVDPPVPILSTPTPSAPTTFTFDLPMVFYQPVQQLSGPKNFAYGWSVFQYQSYRQLPPSDIKPLFPQYATTSFNWIKVTANPASAELCGVNRLPQHVLLRLNKADANATAQNVADDTWTWAHNMEDKPGVNQCVDAFEIGNEPNLSAPGQFNGKVNPVLYADQLCAAYDAIKKTDPSFMVVSAGLAPTGGSSDQTFAMESLTFLRAMLNEIKANPVSHGDPGGCFDVLGYHNYGFRTGYQTDPHDPACQFAMCYRGVEDAWAVLQQYGINKRIWSTETGWMRNFEPTCSQAPWAGTFAGFPLSDQAQADNLVGAFQYARANWPWLGAIFVFNLDFNPPRRSSDPCYDEQGWFAVQGHIAEAALEAMPKS